MFRKKNFKKFSTNGNPRNKAALKHPDSSKTLRFTTRPKQYAQYLTRENRRFLKEKAIRYTGEPLGRKPVKEIRSRYQKRKERRETAERNQVEGKFGQGKRGYGLNDIRARLSSTSNSWIGAIIFVMNLIRRMRDIPLPNLVSLLLKLMRVRNINIYSLRPQLNFCA